MTAPQLALGLLALTVVVAAWWPIRAAHARRMEQAFDDRHAHDADGVVVGAEPYHLRGTRAGAVLLLHGFNDSPQAVRPLADALHAAGWTVHVPLLPGHGRTLKAFARATADEWYDAAQSAYAALRREHAQIAVGGLSMGGAIAARLASEHPEIVAYVGIAPYLRMPHGAAIVLAIAPVASLVTVYLAGGTRGSIQDPAAAASIIAYRASTPGLMRELHRVVARARAALGGLRAPVLIIQSREDPRIAPWAASDAFARIGSTDKTLDWVTGAGHVLTLDRTHKALEERVVSWLEKRLT